MNETSFLIKDLTNDSEEINNIIHPNKSYLIQISKNKLIFRVMKIIEELYYIDMTYVECKGLDSYSKLTINTDEQIISYDKMLDSIESVVYDYKDKSLNIYFNNNYFDKYLDGFYVDIDNLHEIKRVYFMKSGDIKFNHIAYYLNKNKPVQLFDNNDSYVYENEEEKQKELCHIKRVIKKSDTSRIITKKGELSFGKTREVIKLYYGSDKYSKSGLAKKFKCSITTINKALDMMSNNHVMNKLIIDRKRPLDTSEKEAIIIYKTFRGERNIKSLVEKYYSEGKCNKRVYTILYSIIGKSQPTQYARLLLQYAKNNGWL